MKKLAVLAGLLIFSGIFLNGCSDNFDIESIDANTLVKIERCIPLNVDPALVIACDKAVFYPEQRIIIINNPVSVAGSHGNDNSWPVKKMGIVNNCLIIEIPDDLSYEISIGPQKWYCRSAFSGGKIEKR